MLPSKYKCGSASLKSLPQHMEHTLQAVFLVDSVATTYLLTVQYTWTLRAV